jgi:hypothetical protein
MARNLVLQTTRSYLKTAAAQALPVWLRTALVVWQWPIDYLPDVNDFNDLVTRLRQVPRRAPQKPLVPARSRRAVVKKAG